MGSANSRRRENMENRDTGEGEENNASSNTNDEDAATAGSASGDPDLATILSYLIRSGQVRILASGGLYDEEDSDYYDDEEDCVRPDKPPPTDPNPDTSNLKDSDIQHQILHDTGCIQNWRQTGRNKSLSQLLQLREVGMSGKQCFSPADCCEVNANYLPNKCEVVARYHHKAFCGVYSQEGDIFLSACQDRCIRTYDTTKGKFKLFKCLQARDVGWSVIDTGFSPDGNYLVYSSWSDSIHICSIHAEHETHNSLHLFPASDHSFCVFSLTFSQDNREIMGGANDGHLYVYDRERNERTLRIDAHEDDVNAVAFADYSSNILCSGGDDGLVKVWDRRTLSESNPEPIGVLAGHFDGITYIDARGDGKYILSNSKDQTIKLWDLRKFSPSDAQEATRREVAKQNWDYRWQQVPKRVVKKSRRINGDTSLMTYRGHCVLNTLVRARFSPQHTTGQRYIYSGCATGAVIIYDILTGKIVKRLEGQHRACVRDVSWHPYDNVITSTSWDSTIAQWTYSCKAPLDSEEDSDLSDSEEEGSRGCRKSRRLRNHKRARRTRSAERVALVN